MDAGTLRRPATLLEFDASALPTTGVQLMRALSLHGVQLETVRARSRPLPWSTAPAHAHALSRQVTLRSPLIFLTARVLNLAFEKTVSVRWTVDGWKTPQKDVPMFYLPGCADPSTDRFYVRGRSPSPTWACALPFVFSPPGRC
jgi:hypothetical protein